MSKIGHRKSLSTSALSVIASSNTAEAAPPPSKPQRERRGRSHLPPGSNEAQPESASLSVLHGLTGMVEERRRERTGDAVKEVKRERGEGSAEELLHDLKSLRSSSKRRLAALYGLGKNLVYACQAEDASALEDFLSLTRKYSVTIAAQADLFAAYSTLLSLLNRHASALSLRSSHTSLPAGDDLAIGLIPELHAIVSMLQGLCLLSQKCKEAIGDECVLEMFIDSLLLLRAQPALKEDKPICYGILELLFCILVDSPKNARTFEKLSGLEAVVRVLKGSGVTKDVRMKCIEFLYFYLLPESEANQRLIASSNADVSNGSLYPPPPPSLGNNRHGPHSKPGQAELDDVNVAFVPMTPRKRPQPSLGFLTPAHRHVSGTSYSSSSTPALPPISGSPIATPQVKVSQSSTGLSRLLDEDSPTERMTPRSESMNRGSSDESGRLGLGMPRTGMSRSSTRPNMSGLSTDPFNLASSSERSHSGSSGSSTVVPSHGIPRSQTQMLSSRPASRLGRSESLRRVSPSPAPREGTAQKSRDGSSGSSLAPRTPRTRHSRTQSHLSGLPPPPPASIPDVPVVPSAHKPGPSKPRAFPANLTRGLPPSMSTPSLAGMAASPKVVLGPAKRVSSITQKAVEKGHKEGEIKSVAEKKEMLGKWLGNVEQLVQGVEKGSFWGSVGKERGE
ncbi:hypothetical protein B9479_000152 [Cryptococcus floricola]|uniref:Cell division control protein 14 n=1 Tax=Cryptococcus floricola TaxID=2591691 RepID=A0A5D3BAM3_9TREE|nr:hypothetical protein B9479_000152 [Cryptococcus floricola]